MASAFIAATACSSTRTASGRSEYPRSRSARLRTCRPSRPPDESPGSSPCLSRSAVLWAGYRHVTGTGPGCMGAVHGVFCASCCRTFRWARSTRRSRRTHRSRRDRTDGATPCHFNRAWVAGRLHRQFVHVAPAFPAAAAWSIRRGGTTRGAAPADSDVIVDEVAVGFFRGAEAIFSRRIPTQFAADEESIVSKPGDAGCERRGVVGLGDDRGSACRPRPRCGHRLTLLSRAHARPRSSP